MQWSWVHIVITNVRFYLSICGLSAWIAYSRQGVTDFLFQIAGIFYARGTDTIGGSGPSLPCRMGRDEPPSVYYDFNFLFDCTFLCSIPGAPLQLPVRNRAGAIRSDGWCRYIAAIAPVQSGRQNVVTAGS